jgi:hypothetical protein
MLASIATISDHLVDSAAYSLLFPYSDEASSTVIDSTAQSSTSSPTSFSFFETYQFRYDDHFTNQSRSPMSNSYRSSRDLYSPSKFTPLSFQPYLLLIQQTTSIHRNLVTTLQNLHTKLITFFSQIHSIKSLSKLTEIEIDPEPTSSHHNHHQLFSHSTSLSKASLPHKPFESFSRSKAQDNHHHSLPHNENEHSKPGFVFPTTSHTFLSFQQLGFNILQSLPTNAHHAQQSHRMGEIEELQEMVGTQSHRMQKMSEQMHEISEITEVVVDQRFYYGVVQSVSATAANTFLNPMAEFTLDHLNFYSRVLIPILSASTEHFATVANVLMHFYTRLCSKFHSDHSIARAISHPHATSSSFLQQHPSVKQQHANSSTLHNSISSSHHQLLFDNRQHALLIIQNLLQCVCSIHDSSLLATSQTQNMNEPQNLHNTQKMLFFKTISLLNNIQWITNEYASIYLISLLSLLFPYANITHTNPSKSDSQHHHQHSLLQSLKNVFFKGMSSNQQSQSPTADDLSSDLLYLDRLLAQPPSESQIGPDGTVLSTRQQQKLSNLRVLVSQLYSLFHNIIFPHSPCPQILQSSSKTSTPSIANQSMFTPTAPTQHLNFTTLLSYILPQLFQLAPFNQLNLALKQSGLIMFYQFMVWLKGISSLSSQSSQSDSTSSTQLASHLSLNQFLAPTYFLHYFSRWTLTLARNEYQKILSSFNNNNNNNTDHFNNMDASNNGTNPANNNPNHFNNHATRLVQHNYQMLLKQFQLFQTRLAISNTSTQSKTNQPTK